MWSCCRRVATNMPGCASPHGGPHPIAHPSPLTCQRWWRPHHHSPPHHHPPLLTPHPSSPVKAGGNRGPLSWAPSEEGHRLGVGAQPGVGVAERPLQPILLGLQAAKVGGDSPAGVGVGVGWEGWEGWKRTAALGLSFGPARSQASRPRGGGGVGGGERRQGPWRALTPGHACRACFTHTHAPTPTPSPWAPDAHPPPTHT